MIVVFCGCDSSFGIEVVGFAYCLRGLIVTCLCLLVVLNNYMFCVEFWNFAVTLTV